MSNVLRNLPSVNELLDSPPLRSLVRRVNRNVVVSGVRRFLDDMRTQVQSAASGMNIPAPSELAQRIADWIAAEEQPALRPVINGTGILLPERLGGPPLAAEAIGAASRVANSYISLDLDLATGEASVREAAATRLVTRLTGAEAATVVNSHAGATVLALAALAGGREVIVSRGHLTEVSPSHRLPDLIAASGAILREVGATNITRASDYAAAIGERSAALLCVHTSNFAVTGAAEQASLAELAALARRSNLPLIGDLGSGSISDMSRYGISGEPVASDRLKAGADLVLFAGDKLLGGPPCGLIAGRKTLIEKLMKHPLAAALRADKLTLAALAATLRLYENESLADRAVPLLSLLATPLENLVNRAERLAPQIAATGVARVEVVAGQAQVGSGILPGQTIATCCLALTPVTGTVELLATALRSGAIAVVGRLERERLLLDLRTVLPRQDVDLVAAVEALAPKSAEHQPDAPARELSD